MFSTGSHVIVHVYSSTFFPILGNSHIVMRENSKHAQLKNIQIIYIMYTEMAEKLHEGYILIYNEDQGY